jgi:transposase
VKEEQEKQRLAAASRSIPRVIVPNGSGKSANLGCAGRAESYYQQLDALRLLRQEVRKDLLTESKKHKVWKRLCEIPSMGPIRASVLLGILQTAHRFRSKRQLWTYSGLGIEVQAAPIIMW